MVMWSSKGNPNLVRKDADVVFHCILLFAVDGFCLASRSGRLLRTVIEAKEWILLWLNKWLKTC